MKPSNLLSCMIHEEYTYEKVKVLICCKEFSLNDKSEGRESFCFQPFHLLERFFILHYLIADL